MGAVSNASESVCSANELEEDPLDSVFSARESVILGDIPNFNSIDLSAAAAAILAYPGDAAGNIEMMSSSQSSSSEDEELSNFLWDTMGGFDPAA